MDTAESNCIIDGKQVCVRPVRPTDLEMESCFFKNLSAESKHWRFLGGVGDLSTKDLERFVTVDGHDSMALVATVEENGTEKQIGVSRYAPGTEYDSREIAVTVADSWQQHGLGRLLMTKLIDHARLQGIVLLYSIDLAENGSMQRLAKELGMSTRHDPDDASQVIYLLYL